MIHDSGNGIIGWLVLVATFAFGFAVDNSGSTPPPSNPVAAVVGVEATHFSYTEVAAWLTMVGGAVIGLVVIGYDRIGRMRITIIKANDEARRDTLTGQLETAHETIKELEVELTRSIAARDADTQRFANENARLTLECTRLMEIVEKVALSNTMQARPATETPKNDANSLSGHFDGTLSGDVSIGGSGG
jgi:hypothetical protein